MSTFSIKPEELPMRIKLHLKAVQEGVRRGIRKGAKDAVKVLQDRTPVDTGELRDSWEIKEDADSVSLENDAPHAGIVERGARPHPVSDEGRKKLAEWAVRKLGVSPEEAEGVAFAIAKRIRERGQDPTYFVKLSLDDMSRALAQHIGKEILDVSRVG
jgi:nucleoid-associated protein YgaU